MGGDPLIIVHHLLCMLGIQVGLQAPEAGVPIALGMFSFEVGSFLYNIWCIDKTVRSLPTWFPVWPAKKLVIVAYHAIMTGSNVFGAYCLAFAVLQNGKAGHWGFASFFAIAGLPLLIVRRKECISSIMGNAEQPVPR